MSPTGVWPQQTEDCVVQTSEDSTTIQVPGSVPNLNTVDVEGMKTILLPKDHVVMLAKKVEKTFFALIHKCLRKQFYWNDKWILICEKYEISSIYLRNKVL